MKNKPKSAPKQIVKKGQFWTIDNKRTVTVARTTRGGEAFLQNVDTGRVSVANIANMLKSRHYHLIEGQLEQAA